MRFRTAGLLVALCPSVGGCLSFGRAQAGMAMSSSDHEGHSGPVAGVDGVFTLPGLRSFDGKSPFPFGFHNSAEVVFAPRRKDFAWGTGLAYFGVPRPVSGHLIVGTNAHVGEVDGRFAFGNISPYVTAGVRASVASDPASVRSEPFLSFDVSGQTYVDYFSDDGLLSTLLCVKFGFGYGR